MTAYDHRFWRNLRSAERDRWMRNFVRGPVLEMGSRARTKLVFTQKDKHSEFHAMQDEAIDSRVMYNQLFSRKGTHLKHRIETILQKVCYEFSSASMSSYQAPFQNPEALPNFPVTGPTILLAHQK